MLPVLVVTHLKSHSLDLISDALAAARVPVVHRNVFTDRTLPPLSEVGGVISLGGQMSVTEVDDFPLLRIEARLIEAALESATPVLGICLGAQLLSRVGGGQVDRLPRRYIGWPSLKPTPAVREDPLFNHLSSAVRVLKWHADAITPPASAIVLGTTASPGCALFRLGPCAWGSQMHLETTERILFGPWLSDPIEKRALVEAGHDQEVFSETSRRLLPPQMRAMQPVFARFAQALGRRALENACA